MEVSPDLAVLAAAARVAQPPRGDALDLVLLALAVLAAAAGFRRGFVVAVLSAVGFVGAALLGSQLAPLLSARLIHGDSAAGQSALGQRLLTLILVVGMALVGQAVLVRLGLWLRRLLAITPARLLDSAGGAVLDVVALLVVAWMVTSAVALAPFPAARSEVRRSVVLGDVNRVLPGAFLRLNARLDRTLQQHGLPSLAGPFGGVPLPGLVPPPDAGAVPPALRAAGAEIVKITGTAPSCSRSLEGSGFVISPEHVLTNAHVVAGVRAPRVTTPSPGGATLPARVVLYDADRDVAVLYVAGLTRPALSFAASVGAGSPAVVAGYPENGPLTAVAARVAGEQSVTGPNIYDNRTVTRDVYPLRARVRPGNSGGPLLSPSGTVDGVVFAASTDQPDVGYALTASEVAGDVAQGRAAYSAVSTGSCD